MQFYPLPLNQLLGVVPPKPCKPIEVDPLLEAGRACELASMPEWTSAKVSQSDIPAIKDYVKDADPQLGMEGLAQSFFDAGIDPSMSLVSQTATLYLKDSLPASEFELTPTGLRRVVAPSRTEDFKFLWKCRVVENPWYVLNLFASRQLTAKDVECMESVYPAEADAISNALLSHIMDTYASDSDIPRPLRVMLAIYFKQPTIKLEQLAAYQAQETDTKAKSSAPNIAEQEIK